MLLAERRLRLDAGERIHLNKFKPRPYQLPIFDAIENKGYKRVLAILPRRAGKDICAWNLIIRQALKRIAVYYYIFPTYSQAKKVIWHSITNESMTFLDYIPKSLIKSLNGQEMKILLVNGSIIQLVGSDNVDSLVGTNPYGVVFSEFALQDPRAYQFLRPVLVGNGGFMVFLSTPRGKNCLWDLYQIAKQNPAWFCYVRSVAETMHIPLEEIEKERAEGLMSDDLIQQEYFCSFELGVEGSYYSKYLDKMRIKHQIGQVPYETGFRVHTAWDLGVRDSTTIIFFQCIGQTIRIIDCYENSKQGLEHYVNVINNKNYVYGKHIAPHDIKVTEFGTGMTRLEKARALGINFTVASDLSVVDGIEAARSCLSKVWIDEQRCEKLLKALENYRQEYDQKRKVYKANPLHDWASHFADAFRYLAISLSKTRDGLSPEELDRRYNDAMLGANSSLPAVFRDDLPNY
jgi:phage terminase large subunit